MSIPCTRACHTHAPTLGEQLPPSLQGDLRLAARALCFLLDRRVERDLSISTTDPGPSCARLAWARPIDAFLLSTRFPPTPGFPHRAHGTSRTKALFVSSSSVTTAAAHQNPPHMNTHLSPSNSGQQLGQKLRYLPQAVKEQHPYNIHCVSGRKQQVPSPLTGTVVLK